MKNQRTKELKDQRTEGSKNEKTKNKLLRFLTAAIFLFAQLNPAWAALTTHSVDADFAGAKLRISDTDTTSVPKLEAYYQEAPADPYTVGLWHFEGNGNDSSGKSHTATAVNAVFTAAGRVGSNAASFDGSGDYLTIPDSDDWNFGSGDFSVDGWVNFNVFTNGVRYLFWSQATDGDNWMRFMRGSDNKVSFESFQSAVYNSNYYTVNTWTPSTGGWHHLAFVRSGSNGYIFIDGISQAVTVGTAFGTIPNYTGNFRIDREVSDSVDNSFNGYLDEFRILKGRALTPEEIKAAASRKPYAVYTSPAIDAGASTAWDTLGWTESGVRTGDGETPLDATGLVASWNFNESSGTTASNGAGPSSCGGTAVNCNGTLTNFASTASQDQAAGTGWTTNNKRWGAGALMFDGTNDYVSVPQSSDFEFGAGNFTVDFWARFNSISGFQNLMGNWTYAGGEGPGWSIQFGGNAASPYLDFRYGISTGGYATQNWTWTPVVGTWYHIAIVRTGTTLKAFINGVAQADKTFDLTITTATQNFMVANEPWNDGVFNGVLDSVRIYKGRALSAAEILSNYNAGNIQFQTRSGTDATPDDGSGWEAWKPTTSETQLLSMDSDAVNWAPSTATGGTITYSGGYTIHTFTSSGTFTTSPRVVQVLVVAGGGGGGGHHYGGGGGGGGLISNTAYSASGNITVTVGAGGIGAIYPAGANGTQGSNSVFGTLTAIGGGYGNASGAGGNGGSGGGGGAGDYAGGAPTSGQGFAGGTGYGWGDQDATGGGGGGAGAVGANSGNTIGGNGGVGLASSISGSSSYYAGGGGGGISVSSGGTPGIGGLGGGGNAVAQANGANGVVNTGGGGGGGSRVSSGGSGGSGIVIVRYLTSSLSINNESNVKMEGTGSMKVTLGAPQVDGNTAALWHMEETSGTGAYIKDATANANHATPTGTTVVDGIFGKARSFNGTSDYVSVPNSSSLQTSTVSIMEWVKKTSTAHGGITAYGSGGWGFYITAAGNLGFGKIGTSEILSTRIISDTNWHLVAVTYDTTTAKFYIDGASAGSPAYANPTFSFTTGVQIGQTPGSTFFQGIIDEVSIFNRILSADEIAETYRMGANHRISRTITSADLSGKTKLPFYVAADRPGTYLEATIGESANANYYLDNSAIATNTVLFLHGDEISGSTSIKDSSNSAKTITASGEAKISGMGKIGNSMYFDGSGNDYFYTDTLSDFNLGSGGIYTIDFWIYPISYSGSLPRIFTLSTGTGADCGGSFGGVYSVTASGKISIGYFGVNELQSTTAISTGKWSHVVFTRDGTNTRIYINGIADASGAIESMPNGNSRVEIGNATDTCATAYHTGYLDEVRIIKGTALSADQIRQTYEYGLRTHPITIDFSAKLDSANLISGSGDTSFIVDATAYGLSQKGANLYPGDKIIVRENIGGTEYIVQGTVKTVDAATGAVTVVWDSGLTFPSGFTANASVFKWQREYFDLTGSLSNQRDAITNFTIRPTNGAEGRTIYLDDFRKAGDYLTDPASSTIESTANRYLQYRAIVTTSDPAVSPSLTGVTVNNAPLTVDHFVINSSNPGPLAGESVTLTITAKDALNNAVTGYNGTVTVSASESQTQNSSASLGTVSSFSGGQATVTLTDTEAEDVTITAADPDTNNPPVISSGQTLVAFAPAAASKIVFTSSAQTLTANTASAAYTVAVRDQYDNLRSSDAIVLDLASSSASGKFDTASGGAFNGTVTLITTSGGTGTFYYKDTIAGSPTLTVSKTGLTSATQDQTVNFGTISPTLTSASYKAGEITNNTIAWTSSALPQNGKIELDFPVGYDLSGTLSVSGNTGATVSASGNTLVITLGTTIAVNSPVSLEVSGIKNPSLLGSTGTYALRAKNAFGTQIDQGTASANTIIAPTLTLLTPSASGISLTGGQSYALTWSYNGEISNGLKLSYSTDGTNYSNTIATSESNDGTYTWTVPFYPGAQTKVKIEDTFYQKLLETSQAQFQSGTFANAQVSGSGNSASATLTNLFGVSPWTSLTNAPAAIDYGGALAAVGTDAIYVLSGNNTTDFWRYNISSKSWDINLAPAPAAVSNGGSLVAVGSNTLYAFAGGNTTNFWKYDIALNTWTTQSTTPSVAATPAGVTSGGDLVAVGSNTLYAFAGGNTVNFWKYDIALNTWTTQVTAPSISATPAGINDGSVLTTLDSNTIYAFRGGESTDFWKYDINSDTWTTQTTTPSIAAAPGGVWIGGALTAFGSDVLYGYGSAYTTDFWKYTISTNTWQKIGQSSIPKEMRSGSDFVAIGTDIYVLRGWNSSDFWKYEPAKEVGWSFLANAPAGVAYEADLVAIGTNTFYALRGMGTTGFWKYDISSGTWTTQTTTPSIPAVPASMGWGSALTTVGDFIYAMGGGNTFWKYDINAKTWITNLQQLPAALGYAGGSGLVAVGSNTLYALRGSDTADLWRYNINSDTWIANLNPAPAIVNIGGAIASVSSKNMLYVLRGRITTDFWGYNINNGNWITLASVPAVVQQGGALVSVDADTLYAFRGNGTTDFWKYTISTDTWVSLPATLKSVNGGGSLVLVGDTVYALRGGGDSGESNVVDFWKYSTTYPASGAFTSAALDSGGNLEYGKLNWSATVPSQSPVSENGLVALWSMENNWNDSKGTNNGTALNGATFTSSSKVGSYAGSFDGVDDYVEVANSASLQYPSNTFTWAAWVKLNIAASQADQDGMLYQTSSTPETNIGLRIYNGGRFDFDTWGGPSPRGWDMLPSLTVPSQGIWYHVAITYNGTTKGIYVNGILENTKVSNFPDLTGNTGPLKIGKCWDVNSGWNGLIDDVRVYSRALTAGEINQLYSISPLKFQLAAKTLDSGWLDSDFVGPDGTASTYFAASGTEIPTSFDTKRYLKYKAYLSTADVSYTPSLNDVSITFTDNNAADSVISDVSDNPFTITVGGALSNTSVAPASTYAGAVGNVSVSFTTAHAIPADGKVVITFPAGFTLNSGAATTASSSTMDGTLAVSTSGQVLTLTRSAGTQQSAGAETITLINIKNPAPGGSSGTFAIQTTTSSGPATGLIDQDLAVAAKHIIGTLTSPAISHTSVKAGAASDTTISFTTISVIPARGKIELDFPVGYDLSGTLAYVSGNNGTTVSASGNTLTLTLGAQIAASTAASIVVSGIKSPQLLGSTGSYPLRTKDSAGAMIDEAVASANTLTAPALNLLTPSDTGIKLYAGQPYEVTWSYDGGTSNNIKLSYSTNGGSSYLKTIAQSEANDNTYTWSVPYDTGTNMKVKVEETFYQKLLDTSDAQFGAGMLSDTRVSGVGSGSGVELGFDLAKGFPIAGGLYHSLALLSDGTIKGSGDNTNGALGDGTTIQRNTLVSILEITKAVAIAGGAHYSLALLSDGTIKAWGWNGYGQLGDGTTIQKTTPVSVSGITNAVAIAGENGHSLALLSDGTIKAWGLNSYGQLGDGTTTDRTTPVSVPGITNAVAIAGELYRHSLALLSDGTIKTWGYNNFGQLGDGTTTDRTTPVSVPGISNAVAIAGGGGHSLALLSDGTVKAWGQNNLGGLGDGTTINRTTPVSVLGITNAVAIAGGSNHSLALLSDGTINAWGYNDEGELGDGTYIRRYTPVNISGISNVGVSNFNEGIRFSSGAFTSRALDTGGNLEYGALSWGVDVPSQSGANALKFQLAAKTADSGWVDSDFVGPDGTVNSYFTTSGTDVPTSLDTKRYLKYKAYVSTANQFYTPALNDVSVTFSDNTASERLISDVSDNTFEITRPEITINAPGNAETDPNFRWIAGRSYEIKWQTRGKTSESWTIEGQWLDDFGGLHTTAILDTQTTITNSSFDGTYYHYSYTWAIPDTHTLTNSAYIRITAYGVDVNNAAVTDSADSDPYFKIVASPQIALVEPLSGAEWFINSVNTIKWTMTEPAGDTNNKTVTLQYAADSPNFANWVTITSAGMNNENSQNSFSWTINKAADLPSGAVKLKVFDNAMASTTDTTAWSFKISNPAITVSAPLSGVVWRIGSTPEIQWLTTAGVSANVKIEYFDGTNWNVVLETEGTANDGIVANDGKFVWTVPNIAPLTAAKIRITDAQAGSATYYQAAIESSNFEIAKPLFTITLPTQSPLRRGGSYTFSWTDDGTMGSNLDVLYAPTGTSFSSIKTQGAFSQDKKSFTWSVPINTAVPQSNAKFQVKDNSSPFGEGTSTAFSLDKQRLTFDDSRVSAASWPVGSQHTIGWSTEGEVTGLYIYYYKGASNIATIDQTANNNALPSGYTNYTNYPKTYSWTIANDDNYLASGTAKVRISAKTPLDAAITSTSAAFTMREPYLTVSLPAIVQNSGKWVQGDTLAFNWSADGYLTNNGQLELAYAALSSQGDNLDAATWVPFATVNISGAAVNSGSFNFRPSDYSVPAGYLALQVRDTNANRLLSKGRSAVFEISTEPYIGILAPLSVPAWRADTDQVIQWQGAGSVSSALKIEYSTDNNTWSVCKDSANVNAENLASIGSFSWRVPAAIKDNTAYIRIMDTQRQVTMMNPTGISAAIKGISLTDYPGKTAGESFTVGGTKTITWSPAVASSAQALVKIEYSTDSAHNTWNPVSESEGTANDGIVSDDGSFDWSIPDALSATAKIRVGSVSGGVSAASANDFKIIGSLEVSAPAASANWIIGTVQTVSWNALKGTFTNVKLQYSPDNGVTWKSMAGVLDAATTVANNGSYSWTVRDDYSATAKVRVYEENGLSNTAESALFTIASPQISISQPSSSNNGNSALTISEPYDLKWTTTGSTGTNNLELKISYDNQANWSVLEADWPNTSPKSITPTSTSVQAWVKITEKSLTHPGAVATAGPFTVLPTPQISLSSPAINSAWTMGKQYEIKWDTQGLVFNTLRISYTLDGTAQTPVWVDIISGQNNSKSFYWTVSDLTSTLSSQVNAKIRITDDTKGTTGYSDLFTIAVPSMNVVRPQGGEVWAVGDSAPVKWSYNGAVIGPLALQYDASGVLSDASPSIVANAAKTGQTSGTYTYNWSVPSGAQTNSVKVRVKDSQRPNSSADSAASFEVIAAPTIEVTSPVDGDVFVIQDAMTVNWKVRGLSADSLSVEYWDDADLDNVKDADETLYTLSSGLSRGSSETSDDYSGKYTGTKTITLPDNAQVSANLKLRLRDTARGYEGLAAGHFRIRGGFELRDETNTANALASSSEWKANTSHTIKWYNKGSFANVKLEYATSSNGTAWGAYAGIIGTLVNSPAADNISSYSWTVPDPHLANYPDEPPQFYYVKLKITNLADTSVFTESPAFKIGYYTVTWKIKDYDTLTLMDSLTVSSTYGGLNYWRVANDGLTSSSDPRYLAKTYPRRYPYGTFATFWSKDSYGDRSDSRTISADTEVTLLLESAASAQTDYKVYAGFAYNEDTDKLKINSWLEKKGTLITSADADVGVGGDGYIKLYDGETLAATLTDSTVDSNGNYWFEASNVVKSVADGGMGLTAGKTYFAKMGIWYRSREYQSGASFEVTINKALKSVTDEIKAMSADIKSNVTGISSTVAAEAAATRSELKTQLESGTAAVKEKLASEVSDLKAQTAKILTAAETTIPEKINSDLAAAIKSDVEPHIKSGILNRDNVVKTGQSLTIRYRTESGKSPAISIYNSKNALMVSGTAMTEVSGTGIYEYTATFAGSWGAGDFSVICSESSLGTVDAIVITVIKHTLDEVAGMTSSVMGSTSNLNDFKGMGASLVNIDAQFKALEQSLSGVGQNIINKVSETKGVVSEMESVYNQLSNLSAQIKSIGATKNVNLEKLYEVSQEKKEDIIYLKNKAEELKAVMEINKKMTENVAKKPIVQSWFEYR